MIFRLDRVLLFSLVVCSLAGTGLAQQSKFRIETDIYVGSVKKPVQQNVTLFQEGVAYDFPREAGFITMVVPATNRLVVLDEKRQVRTDVDLAELQRLLDSTKNGAPGLLAQIIAESDNVESAGETITVGASILKYDATFQKPPAADMATAYADFADALVRLNARFEPAALPYARLNLNRVLAEKSVLPKEITKTLALGDKPQVTRSKLHANWRLTAEDERRITRVQSMLVSFKDLSQREFFDPPVLAGASADVPK